MPTIENFPKYIETTDHQLFRIDRVFMDYLALLSKDGEVIYYKYKDGKFYDGDKNLLDLKPLTPRLYKGCKTFRKLK